MTLAECFKRILDDAEKTLDMATGETPESRAAAKEKLKKFVKNLVGAKGEGEKKDEEK